MRWGVNTRGKIILPVETIRALMTLVAQNDQPHRRVYDQALCTT